MSGDAAVTLDARGMRCPWPAIRLGRALREGDGAVEVLADDPAAERELAALAAAQGRPFQVIAAGRFHVGGINPLFTAAS